MTREPPWLLTVAISASGKQLSIAILPGKKPLFAIHPTTTTGKLLLFAVATRQVAVQTRRANEVVDDPQQRSAVADERARKRAHPLLDGKQGKSRGQT